MISDRRLRNSGLSGPGFATAAEVVRHHGAMQAQEFALALWSVGQRARGLVEADVLGALADGSIVRTHVLRPTWHFVAREDLRWLLALTAPRIQRSTAGRRRELGLDAGVLDRCGEAFAKALAGGRHLARDGMARALDEAGVDRSGQRLPHMLLHWELEGLLCSGAPAGRQHTWALLEERVPPAPARGLEELVRRYLASHGPASVKDLAWWASQPVTALRKALDEVGAVAEARDLWSLPDEPAAPPARGALLLQPYDEMVVGYTESRHLGDPGRMLALVLVDGRVVGHWRRPRGRVEVVGYEAGPALEAEIREFERFTARA